MDERRRAFDSFVERHEVAWELGMAFLAPCATQAL